MKTSTYINDKIYTELKEWLDHKDISLREFIEYSFMQVRSNKEMENKILYESKQLCVDFLNERK